MVEDEVLPRGVQLGEHVVQQQNRLFSGVSSQKLALGELQTDRGGARLSLRAEGFDGNAV